MPDLQTRVEHLEADVKDVKGEAAVANAAVQLVHDNVVHLAGRVDRGFSEMRSSFARVDQRLEYVDAELGEMRGQITGLRDEVKGLREEMTEMRERTSRVESLLLQVLERLPERS